MIFKGFLNSQMHTEGMIQFTLWIQNKRKDLYHQHKNEPYNVLVDHYHHHPSIINVQGTQ